MSAISSAMITKARKWKALELELSAGMAAEESEFVALDADSILAEARQRKGA